MGLEASLTEHLRVLAQLLQNTHRQLVCTHTHYLHLSPQIQTKLTIIYHHLPPATTITCPVEQNGLLPWDESCNCPNATLTSAKAVSTPVLQHQSSSAARHRHSSSKTFQTSKTQGINTTAMTNPTHCFYLAACFEGQEEGKFPGVLLVHL